MKKSFAQFEVGRTYQEKEVNEIISRMHEDYCMVRRAFIGMGWMTRDKTAYTVIGINDNEERVKRARRSGHISLARAGFRSVSARNGG